MEQDQPLSITQGQEFLSGVRSRNPQLSDVSDLDLARMYKDKFGTNKLDFYLEHSDASTRLAARLNNVMNTYVAEPIEKALGGGVTGEIGGGIASSSPELALMGGTALTGNPYVAAGGTLSAGIMAALRSYADTGDKLSSALSFGTTVAAPGAAKLGTKAVEKVVGKLGSSALTKAGKPVLSTGQKLASDAVGGFLGGEAASVPQQLLSSSEPTDDDLGERIEKNVSRLSEPRNLAVQLGSDLGFSALGIAQDLGARRLAKITTRQNTDPFVKEDVSGSDFTNYDDARFYLQSRGIPVESNNTPAAVMSVANDLASSSSKYVNEDWAKESLIRDKKRNLEKGESLSQDEETFLSSRMATAKDRTQSLLREQLLGLAPNDSRPAQQKLQDTLDAASYHGLVEFGRDEPEGLANMIDDIRKKQNQEAIVLGSPEFKGRTQGTVESIYQSLKDYNAGKLTLNDLINVHPGMLEVVSRRDSLVTELLSDKNLAQQVTSGQRKFFSEEHGKVEKALDKQSRAFKTLSQYVDFAGASGDVVKAPDHLINPEVKAEQAQNEKTWSFAKDREAALGSVEAQLGTIQLAALHPRARTALDSIMDNGLRRRRHSVKLYVNLGQDEAKTLSTEEALRRGEDKLNRLMTKEGEADSKKLAKAFSEENEKAESNPGLLTDEELSSKFGIKDDLLHTYKVLRNVPMEMAKTGYEYSRVQDNLKVAKALVDVSGKTLRHEDAQKLAKMMDDYVEQGLVPKKGSKIFDAVVKTSSDDFAKLAKGFGVSIDENTATALFHSILTNKANRRRYLATRARLGYLPMQRRGEYGVTLRQEKTEEDGTSSYNFKTIDGETKKEVEDKVNKAYALNEGWEVSRSWTPQDRKDFAYVDYDTLKELQRKSSGRMLSLIDELKKEGKLTPTLENILRDFATQESPLDEAFEAITKDSVKQYNLHRSGVEGFDPSQFLPNILDYSRLNANFLENSLTKSIVDFETSRPYFDEVQGLREEVNNRLKYALGQDNKTANKIRSFATHWYVTASVRNMLLQSTQNALTGIGPLTKRTGSYTQAIRRLTTGLKMLTKWTFTGTTGNDLVDTTLRRAKEDGVLDSDMYNLFFKSENLENFGMSGRGVGARSNTVLKNVLHYLGTLNRYAEQSNRIWSISALASHEFAKIEKAGRRPTTEEMDRIYKEAKDFSTEVNFNGDRGNRAGFLMRSQSPTVQNAALVATTLQTFTINHMGQLYQLYKEAGGRKGLLRNKPLQAALLHLGIIGGGLGYPGFKLLLNLISSATGEDEEEKIRKEMRGFSSLFTGHDSEWDNILVDSLLNGTPAAFGLDSAASLGLGSPVQWDPNQDTSDNILAIMGGAPLSVSKAIYNATLGNIGKGDFSSALKAAAPTSIKYYLNVMAATRDGKMMNQKGVAFDTGGKDQLATLLGFQPLAVTQKKKAWNVNRQMLEDASQVKDKFADKVAWALVNGTREDAQEAFATAREELGPTLDIQSFLNMVEQRVFARRYGQFINNPSYNQGKILQELKQAFGDRAPQVASPIKKLQNEVEVTNTLGDPVTRMKMLQALPKKMREAVMQQAFLERGINPQAMKGLQRGGFESRQRALEAFASGEASVPSSLVQDDEL